MLRFFVFCLLCYTHVIYAQDIRFAPLPKEKAETLEKEYKPFLKWLSSKTGDNYHLVLSVDYNDLIKKIKAGDIDIAYLGPLPYAMIKQHTDTIVPIVKFLDRDGKDSYTCSIVVRKECDRQGIKELRDKKISLPQKYSTCGYYNAKLAFKKNGVENFEYTFDGNHENVALKVVLGESDVGSLQSIYFYKYKYLGLKRVYESEAMPGFLLAANKQKLSNEKIEKIKQEITKLSPLTKKADAETTKDWGSNIKYGAVAATESDYRQIAENFKSMPALK